jgi:hypothetical protein
VRPSAALGLAAIPIVVGVGIGLAITRPRDLAVEILRGGERFRVAAGPARPVPGTFTLDADGRLSLAVTNRDTVDHLVGVVVAPAGRTTRIPAEYCTAAREGDRAVVVVR